jgi:hypothetical protein
MRTFIAIVMISVHGSINVAIPGVISYCCIYYCRVPHTPVLIYEDQQDDQRSAHHFTLRVACPHDTAMHVCLWVVRGGDGEVARRVLCNRAKCVGHLYVCTVWSAGDVVMATNLTVKQ